MKVPPHPTLYHIWPYFFAAPPFEVIPLCSFTHQDVRAMRQFTGFLDKDRRELQRLGLLAPSPFGGGW